MAISMIFASVLAALLIVYLLKRYYGSSKSIPVPWNAPLVGSLPWIVWSLYRSKAPFYEFMRQLKFTYGNIYAFNILGQQVVVVNDFQAIKKAFDSPHVSARPALSCYTHGHEKGLVLGSGDLWRQQRQFTQATFRTFGVGKKSFEDKIALESEALITDMSQLKGSVFETSGVLINAVSNVVCAVVFGKRFEYTDAKFLKFQMLSGQQATIAISIFPELFLPALRFFNSKNKQEGLKNTCKLLAFMDEIIKEHKVDFDPNHLRDYIDVYLKELRLQNEGNGTKCTKMDEESMKMTISQLFAAGTDSTAGTLDWGLAYMVAYPHVQTRVQKEIDEVVGRDRLPKLSDKPSLPYTCATILEIQRLTRTRISVPHLCTKSISVSGVTIPEDAIVVGNIWAVHRDPAVWSDPEAFIPERFLDQKGEVYQPDEFIPFSIGRRVCLGDKLAKMELYIFFSHLLHQFTFEPMEPTDDRESLDPGIEMNPKYPKLRAIQRE